jgi:hypothetical protein
MHLPTGIALDATTKFFFQDHSEESILDKTYSVFLEIAALFDDTDSRNHFAMLTLGGLFYRSIEDGSSFSLRDT